MKALCLCWCRFEFPTELDMYKYTVEGLEQAELATDSDSSMHATSEGHSKAQAAPDPAMYHYSLKGIVVHSGTAFAGHYYSFIQVGTSPCQSGDIRLNHIQQRCLSNLERNCWRLKGCVSVAQAMLGSSKNSLRPQGYLFLLNRMLD